MQVFVRAVEAGGFTKATRTLQISASAVSKAISRLEERLGVRLLHRTTRSVALTDDGAAFFERAQRILAEVEDAELAMARSREVPRGKLRVDAPVALGRSKVAPLLPKLLAAHPELAVELTLRDHLIDIVAEGIDVAVRMVQPEDTGLVAKRLGTTYVLVCGSPAYFAKHAPPRVPGDLAKHECIRYLRGGEENEWRFAGPHEVPITVPIRGRFVANSTETLIDAAIAGVGIVRMFDFAIAEAVAKGQLQVVLHDFALEARPIFALYPRNRHLSPRVRVFVDALVAAFAGPVDVSKGGAPVRGPKRRQKRTR